MHILYFSDCFTYWYHHTVAQYGFGRGRLGIRTPSVIIALKCASHLLFESGANIPHYWTQLDHAIRSLFITTIYLSTHTLPIAAGNSSACLFLPFSPTNNSSVQRTVATPARALALSIQRTSADGNFDIFAPQVFAVFQFSAISEIENICGWLENLRSFDNFEISKAKFDIFSRYVCTRSSGILYPFHVRSYYDVRTEYAKLVPLKYGTGTGG